MDELPTIVIVDDDQDTLDFLCDFFSMQGMVAVRCPSSPQDT